MALDYAKIRQVVNRIVWNFIDIIAINKSALSQAIIHNIYNTLGTIPPCNLPSVEDIVRVMTNKWATCDDTQGCSYCAICAYKTAQAILSMLEERK